MAKKKISQLVAVTSLDGNEPVALVQSGVTKKATINQIVSFIGGTYINGSGTAGKFAKFTDGDTIGNSIVSESGGVVTISTGVANTQPLLVGDGTQGLRIGAYAGGLGYGAIYTQSVTPDGSNFTLAGLDTRTLLNAPLSGTVELGVGAVTKLNVSATELITFGATDTGEAHIFGGSARVNGELKISTGNNISIVGGDIQFQNNAGFGILSADSNRLLSIQNEYFTIFGITGIGVQSVGSDGGFVPRLAVGNPSNSSQFVAIGYDNTNDVGFIHSIHRATSWKNLAIQASGGNVLIGTTTDNGTDKLQVNGSAKFFGGVVTNGNFRVDKASPRIELWNLTTANGAYSVAVTNTNLFRIENDFAGTIPLSINNSSEATFLSTVQSTGFILGNGQYLKAYRTSGGLLIDVLGIEPGTDNTRLQITGDFNIKNGAGDSLLNMNTSGLATFLSSVISLSLKTEEPTSGTAVFWKLGSVVSSGGQSLDNTRYVEVEIDGTFYKLAVLN